MVRKFRLTSLYQLYLLIAVPMLVLIVFSYIPMVGLLIAFQDYNIFKGFFGSEWVGFQIFGEVFAMKDFWQALLNTLVLNTLNLLIGFPAPIILALLINEIKPMGAKRAFQSTLYLPHFLSWAIVGSIAMQLLSDQTGLVNNLIRSMGGEPITFLSNKWNWLFTYLGIGVWQNAGWGTIIYLAAITGINPELYEAAEVDGASRLRKIWSITLPGISSTMIILLVLQVGRLVSIGFEQPYVLGNDLVREFSDVISTYVYRMGIVSAQYNVGTAVGLFQSVVGLVLLLSMNWLSRKYSDNSVF